MTLCARIYTKFKEQKKKKKNQDIIIDDMKINNSNELLIHLFMLIMKNVIPVKRGESLKFKLTLCWRKG